MLDKEDIKNWNKIIANFMKVKFAETFWQNFWLKGIPVEQLRYHKDWNWLIPVVEKIESIYSEHHGYFGVHISSNSCSIQGTKLHLAIEKNSKYGYVYMSDPNAILETKLESTYYNVVAFIKWYNIVKEKI